MSDRNQTKDADPAADRFGTVAILGRTNDGKSTFLNAALGESLAIVSPRPQTTRDSELGGVRRGGAQLAFVDTPGLHRPRSELGRRMNATAWESARHADVVVFMTAWPLARKPSRPGAAASGPIGDEDQALIASLPKETPAIAVVNKIDLVRNKSLLLPVLAELDRVGRFEALVPVSVATRDGVDRVLDEVVARLPEGDPGYPDDTLTDRPMSFFAREYIREQVLLTTGREVPHAVAVTLDRFDENKRVTHIQATLHVEKTGQRGILIGRGGTKLKEIGTGARARIEALVGGRVRLELFVRVTPRWKSVPRQLAEMGYDAARAAPQAGHPVSEAEDS
jgi:GTP-binding protein Era